MLKNAQPSVSIQPTDQPVPLLDVARENQPLAEEFARVMADVIDSGQFILGAKCRELESAIAMHTGAAFGVGCASGSDALLLCMMALDIGPGDEVLLPSFTFFATASAVRRLGATPIFVDIQPDSFNMDPEDLQRKITSRTRAILPVHLFGRCADMTRIMNIANAHDLSVVEDCAQSIGASHAGRTSGSFGLAGCFSFYPTKNLGGVGDGGMITTSDPELAERLRILREHGMKPRYVHDTIGINSRLDSLQAAVLLVKLHHLAAWTEKRRQNARRYDELFAHAFVEQPALREHEDLLILPPTDSVGIPVWNQYTVRIRKGHRDQLRNHLTQSRIGSEVYYPLPLHRQTCFADLPTPKGSLPATEQAASEVLSLPIFPHLTLSEQHTIVDAITGYFRSQTG